MAMRIKKLSHLLLLSGGLLLGVNPALAKPKPMKDAVSLTSEGKKLEANYATSLKGLQSEISRSLPSVNDRKRAALKAATEAVKKAETNAEAAQNGQGDINKAKALVDHAKGKWIGGAEKGIAAAEAALKKAKTDAERDAAKKDLASWQKNKEDGLAALKERQAAYDKARTGEARFRAANDAAQAELAKAQAAETSASNDIQADLAPVLSSDKLDAKLVKCTILAAATPAGLAEFAQQGRDKEALVEKLLANDNLMKEMLVAGGVDYGKYGQAMEIFTKIQKASPKAGSGNLLRLALATSLEHAVPIAQSNPKDDTTSPAVVNPVKRYLHYEKAFLDGELDPAFKNLTTWEYRQVVNCDAPDEILAWGREMLRNYRPDHIYSNNYGWRYVSTVKTEGPYGSQNVKCDLSTSHNYQNIIMNGGICGRRAFFGRFILRTFGIPVWGVTQKAHAALSHWTPQGWVVNLGAGFSHSWWDKDEMSLSGTQFLVETQARGHAQEYPQVLRAQWISCILGEDAYNERRKVAGGFWSSMAHYQAVTLASKAVTLGPLGQELAEANEPEEKLKGESGKVAAADLKVIVENGAIVIPAVAHEKPSGKFSDMKSYLGGMQLHCLGGFKTQYEFKAPQKGKYALSAKVVTVQEGQIFLISANDSKQPVENPVPYTLGEWQQTKPIEVELDQGRNVINFELKQGSRGVTVKDFTLKALN
jgi:hypothetical protein